MGLLHQTRPHRGEYYMGIAMAVRRRASCGGNRVGAIVVLEDRIIATGYNGTPQGMRNCDEGGCERCTNRDKYQGGQGYDVCICVHAEQNTLLTAARFGIPVEGSVIYTTMRPCFGCTKELLQAKVRAVYYLHEWSHPNPDPELQRQYQVLQAHFADGVHRLELEDPDAAWAVSAMRREETAGESVPA